MRQRYLELAVGRVELTQGVAQKPTEAYAPFVRVLFKVSVLQSADGARPAAASLFKF